jgi:hypothetical protein
MMEIISIFGKEVKELQSFNMVEMERRLEKSSNSLLTSSIKTQNKFL